MDKENSGNKNKLKMGLIITGLFVAIFLFGSFYSTQKATHVVQTQSQWQEFNSVIGSFKILFPTSPEEKIQGDQSNGITTFKGELYSSVLNDSVAYFVSFTEYLTKMDTSNLDGNLEKVANGMAAIYPESKLTSANLIDFNGHRGIDFLINITSENMYIKGRATMVGQRLYVIYETYKTGSYNDSDYNKFINSFQLQ
ncbi:hypothetical protein M1513_00155 [Patescibacteria group bacterium]|nr:hypothetical protein [Patescibacteria group bacterium]MCL5733565.1 hypothetical protein [Patescibacteria group bacterium]